MRDLGQILIEQGIGEQFREALEDTAPTTLPALEPAPAFTGNREQRRAAARGKPIRVRHEWGQSVKRAMQK